MHACLETLPRLWTPTLKSTLACSGIVSWLICKMGHPPLLFRTLMRTFKISPYIATLITDAIAILPTNRPPPPPRLFSNTKENNENYFPRIHCPQMYISHTNNPTPSPPRRDYRHPLYIPPPLMCSFVSLFSITQFRFIPIVAPFKILYNDARLIQITYKHRKHWNTFFFVSLIIVIWLYWTSGVLYLNEPFIREIFRNVNIFSGYCVPIYIVSLCIYFYLAEPYYFTDHLFIFVRYKSS